MKAKRRILLALISLIILPLCADAKGAGGGRRGGGGGTSDHGGGNDDSGVTKGELYGDLYLIERDDAGLPVLYTWEQDEFGEWVPSLDAENGFVQPVDADGRLIPLTEEGEVISDYEEFVQEVELGRLNVVRSKDDVLAASYEEALAAINAATNITNDAGGRIVLIADEVEKTIDSPLENLALYQKLLENGYLTGITNTNDFGSLEFLKGSGSPTGNEVLDQAASFLAAAADKGSGMSIDKLIYLNDALGLNDPLKGEYFDFGEYSYDRNMYSSAFAILLDGPALESMELDGEIRDFIFYVNEVNIMDFVFDGASFVSPISGARAFAESAWDANEVILYLHERAVPAF